MAGPLSEFSREPFGLTVECAVGGITFGSLFAHVSMTPNLTLRGRGMKLSISAGFAAVAAAFALVSVGDVVAQGADQRTYCVEQSPWRVCRVDASLIYHIAGVLEEGQRVYSHTLSASLQSDDDEVTWSSACPLEGSYKAVPSHHLFGAAWPQAETEYHLEVQQPGANHVSRHVVGGAMSGPVMGDVLPSLWLAGEADGELTITVAHQFAGEWKSTAVTVEVSEASRNMFLLFQDLCGVL